MLRRLLRLAFRLGLVAAAVAAAAKALGRRRSTAPDWSTGTEPWPPIQAPPEQPATVDTPPPPENGQAAASSDGQAASGTVGTERWVDPDDGGTCPASHPIKAKLSSGVFHLPGMANYERTKADRCYPDEAAAEADGLRQAKR